MRRFLPAFLLCLAGSLPAQDSGASGRPAELSAILAAYERAFLRTDLSGKAGILRDAALDGEAPEFIGELYEFALDFSIRNADILRDDPDFVVLAALAAGGAGNLGRKNAVPAIWTVFGSFRDPLIRLEALGALAVLGEGDAELAENLARFLEEQEGLYRSGAETDLPVLAACAGALGRIGGTAAIPALLDLLRADFPAPVPEAVRDALAALPDQEAYLEYLEELIRRRPGPEKTAAFRAGMENAAFGEAERGRLAELALETALEDPSGWDGALEELRYAAVRSLGELRWVRAAPLVMRNYTLLSRHYALGTAPRERLLEALRCLGVMENAGAAQILSLELGRMNVRRERSGDGDEELALALVGALGELGHRTAFDNLSYVTHLSWSEPVQLAAREALNRLKW